MGITSARPVRFAFRAIGTLILSLLAGGCALVLRDEGGDKGFAASLEGPSGTPNPHPPGIVTEKIMGIAIRGDELLVGYKSSIRITLPVDDCRIIILDGDEVTAKQMSSFLRGKNICLYGAKNQGEPR